ncbi:MAG TPA: allantoinase AllB [Minicystis sp.]|nr:allantoinase AllB [Minicystis sp.]
MPAERIVRGRRVVLPHGVLAASIHVERGRVAAVRAFDDVPDGAPVVDAGDLVVSPGVVDSHVHLNEPGRTQWEGFETATRAAAAGGVTTLVDMPLNSIPPTTTVAHLDEKRAAAEGRVSVDVGFWGGVVPGNAKDLRPLLDAGALGFKCFMIESGVDEFPCVGEADIAAAMRELAGTGAPLLAHAELPGPIAEAARAIAGRDPRDYATYLASRPAAAEDEAVRLLVALCRATSARVHVVHLASSSALDVVRRARDDRLPFTVETTPHYLHFAAEDVPPGATPFKCAPPIRERAVREGLWSGLTEGLVDLVVSDHSPCSPDLKRLEAGDFAAAWGGISGLQLALPVVWTEARRRGRSLADVARWMSEGPAKLAGLASKGAIAPGKDADFVLWDPEALFRVEPARLSHRHKVTPYAGEELAGIVVATVLRGETVFASDGAPEGLGPAAATPRGRLLSRGSA